MRYIFDGIHAPCPSTKRVFQPNSWCGCFLWCQLEFVVPTDIGLCGARTSVQKPEHNRCLSGLLAAHYVHCRFYTCIQICLCRRRTNREAIIQSLCEILYFKIAYILSTFFFSRSFDSFTNVQISLRMLLWGGSRSSSWFRLLEEPVSGVEESSAPICGNSCSEDGGLLLLRESEFTIHACRNHHSVELVDRNA